MQSRNLVATSSCCLTLAVLFGACQDDSSSDVTTFGTFTTADSGLTETGDGDNGDGDGDPGDGDGDNGDGDGDGDPGDGDGDGDGDPAFCGDGVVEGDEACDDGNMVDTDDCLTTCDAPSCGDGFLWANNETCDDGNMDATDDCTSDCAPAACGDGFVWANNEVCDDGNMDDTDDCLGSCEAPSCGDGFVWANNEECDDANDVNTDACIAGCLAATCGDGFVQDGVEECDDDSNGCENCMSTCDPGQVTVLIPFNMTMGWLSQGCCGQQNYRVANDLNDALTASFMDPIPPGATVTNVSVRAGVEHACNGGVAMTFQLNNMDIGTWGSGQGPDCACGNPAVGNANFSGTNQYLEGQQNTIRVVHNAGGSCHEALTSVPNQMAGTAFAVVIDYDC